MAANDELLMYEVEVVFTVMATSEDGAINDVRDTLTDLHERAAIPEFEVGTAGEVD